MRNTNLIALTVFVFAWLGCSVHATTYYVDPGFGSDTNSGTALTSAWAHLPGVVGTNGSGWVALMDGDTLIVKGGTTNSAEVIFTPDFYNGAARFDSIKVQSGHLANPPWGAGQAIFDGQKSSTFGFWFTGNYSSGALQGVTLDGFEVRNIAPGAVSGFDANNGSSCILVGGNYPASYLTIKRCWLHDAYRNADDRGHGIEFGGSANWIITQNQIGPNIGTKGIEPFRASYGAISNNMISGTGDHCIALSLSTNVDVCNNVIYNIPPQVHEPQFSLALSGSECCDIWNNIIYRPTNVVNAAGQDWSMGIGMYTTCVSNRIAFNTVAYFGDYLNGGIQTIVSLFASTLPNTNLGTLFQNNIVYKGFNHFGATQWYVQTNAVGSETVNFNLFFNSAGSDNTGSYGDGTNYFYAPMPLYNLGPGHNYANNMQLDPLFTAGVLPSGLDSNYHPNTTYFKPTFATSPQILTTGNKLLGDAVHGYSSDPNKFSTDILGVKRTGWSMGAYEMSPSVLPAPTGLRIVPGP